MFSFSRIVCFFLLQLILAVSSQAYILTKSAPVYFFDYHSNSGYVLFQGMDNGLYEINANDPELFEATWNDALDLTQSKATLLGHTASQPCVHSNPLGTSTVYYQYAATHDDLPVASDDELPVASDSELCKVNIDGTGFQDLDYKTHSTPCIDESGSDEHIYFQYCDTLNLDPTTSRDNDLCKISRDGTGFLDFGYKTASTPCFFWAMNHKIYCKEPTLFFQAFDEVSDPSVSINNHLCRIRTSDGGEFIDLKQTIASKPWVGESDVWYYTWCDVEGCRVYFQTLANDLGSVQTDGACFLDYQIQILEAPFGPAGSTQCYFDGMDQNYDQGLFCLSWEDASSWNQRAPLLLKKEFIKSTPTQNAFSRTNFLGERHLYIQDSNNKLKALFMEPYRP